MVISNVDVSQEMIDELEGPIIEALVWGRLVDFEQADAVSHEDMRARYTEKD
jgi:antitoxin StbD